MKLPNTFIDFHTSIHFNISSGIKLLKKYCLFSPGRQKMKACMDIMVDKRLINARMYDAAANDYTKFQSLLDRDEDLKQQFEDFNPKFQRYMIRP